MLYGPGVLVSAGLDDWIGLDWMSGAVSGRC